MSDQIKLCKIYLIINSCVCALSLTLLALNLELNPICYFLIFSSCMFGILYINYPTSHRNYNDDLFMNPIAKAIEQKCSKLQDSEI